MNKLNLFILMLLNILCLSLDSNMAFAQTGIARVPSFFQSHFQPQRLEQPQGAWWNPFAAWNESVESNPPERFLEFKLNAGCGAFLRVAFTRDALMRTYLFHRVYLKLPQPEQQNYPEEIGIYSSNVVLRGHFTGGRTYHWPRPVEQSPIINLLNYLRPFNQAENQVIAAHVSQRLVEIVAMSQWVASGNEDQALEYLRTHWNQHPIACFIPEQRR